MVIPSATNALKSSSPTQPVKVAPLIPVKEATPPLSVVGLYKRRNLRPPVGVKDKVVFVLLAVALALNSNVVLFVTLATVAPTGIPVPVTPIPANIFNVESIVIVASVLMVSQVESVKVIICSRLPNVAENNVAFTVAFTVKVVPT